LIFLDPADPGGENGFPDDPRGQVNGELRVDETVFEGSAGGEVGDNVKGSAIGGGTGDKGRAYDDETEFSLILPALDPSLLENGDVPNDLDLIGYDSGGSGDLFTPTIDFGPDGPGFAAYSLVLGDGDDSGLTDTRSGQPVVLDQTNPTTIVGRAGDEGEPVLQLSIDPTTGEVTILQFRAVYHNVNDDQDPKGINAPANTTNPEQAFGDPDEYGAPEHFDAGVISAQLTVTDSNGDTATGSVDIGTRIRFEDDGPELVGEPDGPVMVSESALDPEAPSEGVEVIGRDPFAVDFLLAGGSLGEEVSASPLGGRETADGQSIFQVKNPGDTARTVYFQHAPTGIEGEVEAEPGLTFFTVAGLTPDVDGNLTFHTDPSFSQASKIGQGNPVGGSAFGLTTVTGDLAPLVDFGADGPAKAGAFKLAFTGAADGEDTSDVSLLTTPEGEQIEVSDETPEGSDVQVLVGRAGGEDGEIVFTMSVNTETGEYAFSQRGSIEHPDRPDQTGAEDPVDLGFELTATDGDGDTVTQALSVRTKDDGPEVTKSTTVTNWGGEAGYHNSFGYFVDQDGDGDWDRGEGDGTIVWADASNDNKGATVTIDGYAKEDLGFFIIPDGENDGFTDGQSGVDLSGDQDIGESTHFLGHPGDASEDMIPKGALGRRYYFDDNGGDPDDDDFSDVQVTVRSEPDAILDEDGLQESGSAPYDGIKDGPGDVPGEDTVATGNLPIDFGADGPGAISFEQNEPFVKTAQGDYVKTLSDHYLKWHWDGDSTLTAQATDDDPTTTTDPSSTPVSGDPFLSVKVTDTATGAYKVTQHKPLKHEPSDKYVLKSLNLGDPEVLQEGAPGGDGEKDGPITKLYKNVTDGNESWDGPALDLKVELIPPQSGSDFEGGDGKAWDAGYHYDLTGDSWQHDGGIQGGADFRYTFIDQDTGEPFVLDKFAIHVTDIDWGPAQQNKEIFRSQDADTVRVSSNKMDVDIHEGQLRLTSHESEPTPEGNDNDNALFHFSGTSQFTLSYFSEDEASHSGDGYPGTWPPSGGDNGGGIDLVDPDSAQFAHYLDATPKGWGTRYEDTLDLNLDYTVTDGDGDSANGTLGVTVDDDSATVEIDELNSSPVVGKDGLAQIEFTAETDYGADGPAACDTTAWSLQLADADIPDYGVKSGLELRSSGENVYLYEDGNGVVGRVGDADGDEALSLQIATEGAGDGQLLVRQYKELDGDLAANKLFAGIGITDGDGDTTTDWQDLDGIDFAQMLAPAPDPDTDILRFDGSGLHSYEDDSPDDDEDALQTALKDASDGDTIWLSEGEFGKEDDKGYTITVDNDEVNIFGANAGTSAQGDRVAESVVHGYLDVNGDDVTVDGLRVESTHESGGDKFLRLDGAETTFANNIVTLDTPLDSGGNGVVAEPDNDTIESNILAWRGNLMGRGDTGFDDAPDCNNDLYGAYWGNDGPLDEDWQTEFIIGTAKNDDDLGPDARTGQPGHQKDQIAEKDLEPDFAAKLNVFVRGEAGDDTIHGSKDEERDYTRDDDFDYPNLDQSGDDTLLGGAGDDEMYGKSGDDLIRGGEGDDLLVGGEGEDILIGGAGDDIFKLNGIDTIRDYIHSGTKEQDILDITDVLIDTEKDRIEGAGDSETELENVLHLTTNSQNQTEVKVDANGNGSKKVVAKLDGAPQDVTIELNWKGSKVSTDDVQPDVS
jgi:hypothetical protein